MKARVETFSARGKVQRSQSMASGLSFNGGADFVWGVMRLPSARRVPSPCHAVGASKRDRWYFARTVSKSNVLSLIESGYFCGTRTSSSPHSSSSSSSCRLLVDLEETSRAEVDGWRRLGFLGEAIMGVDAAGDVWEMREDDGSEVSDARVGIFRRVGGSEDAAELIVVRVAHRRRTSFFDVSWCSHRETFFARCSSCRR